MTTPLRMCSKRLLVAAVIFLFQSLTVEAQQLSPADAQKLRPQIEGQGKAVPGFQGGVSAPEKELEAIHPPAPGPAPGFRPVKKGAGGRPAPPKAEAPKPAAPKWFEKYSFR